MKKEHADRAYQEYLQVYTGMKEANLLLDRLGDAANDEEAKAIATRSNELALTLRGIAVNLDNLANNVTHNYGE